MATNKYGTTTSGKKWLDYLDTITTPGAPSVVPVTPGTIPNYSGGFSGSGGSTVNPVSGWVNPNSIGALQAAGGAGLFDAIVAFNQAKLEKAAGEAYQQYLAARHRARFAPGDPNTDMAVAAALQAWTDAKAAAQAGAQAEAPVAPLDMTEWNKGYAAQQTRFTAAGGGDAYWAGFNTTAVAPVAPAVRGLSYGSVASAPHRIGATASTPAVASTVNEVMAEMASKQASEGSAVMQVNTLSGYKPIKLRPRSR